MLTTGKWSFRKTATMGTLTSQAEIGVWIQAEHRDAYNPAAQGCGSPSHAAAVRSITPGKNSEIVCAKSFNLVYFWHENGSQCRPECILEYFNNGNDVSTRSSSKWPCYWASWAMELDSSFSRRRRYTVQLTPICKNSGKYFLLLFQIALCRIQYSTLIAIL